MFNKDLRTTAVPEHYLRVVHLVGMGTPPTIRPEMKNISHYAIKKRPSDETGPSQAKRHKSSTNVAAMIDLTSEPSTSVLRRFSAPSTSSSATLNRSQVPAFPRAPGKHIYKIYVKKSYQRKNYNS